MKNKTTIAFTIIEILVASSLFMMLMGIASFSFQRLNAGGVYAQKIVELHKRSDAIIRMMEDDMRTLQQTVAVHVDTTTIPHSFTFMRQVTNYVEMGFGGNDLVSGIAGIGQEEAHRTDLLWVKWEWGNGGLSRGHSQAHFTFNGRTDNRRYTDNTKEYIKSYNFKTSGTEYRGMHRNGIPPTPQRYFVNYYGNGTFVSVKGDGSTAARPGDQIHVYRQVNSSAYDGNDCAYFDELDSPWIEGDYSHWYTTYIVGDDQVLSDQAFAVCNVDGLTFNKDRLNLEGSDDQVGGNYFYPNRMQLLFSGVEYMTMQLLKRDGSEITTVDDDDTINDGSDSIDINGVAADGSGTGIEKRPYLVRVSFLLHSLDQNEIDASDYDADGDDTELLVQAVRDMVGLEGLVTRAEQVKSFRRHCRSLSETSIIVNYVIKLSL